MYSLSTDIAGTLRRIERGGGIDPTRYTEDQKAYYSSGGPR